MSLLCLIGRHKPSLPSLKRYGQDGYKALCENCGTPLLGSRKGSWRPDRSAAETMPERQSPSAKAELDD
jgi:hypothetical protein